MAWYVFSFKTLRLACLYCSGTRDNPGVPGEERTFATLLRDYSAYRDPDNNNCNKDRQSEFNNVTLPCLLIPPDPTISVLSFIPLPQLHLMMGAVNHPYNLLRSLMGTNNRCPQFDKWCSTNSITRRGEQCGYQGDKNSTTSDLNCLFIKTCVSLKINTWYNLISNIIAL